MSKYNLLYIDDEVDNLELFSQALDGKFNVDTTTDPNKALELLNKKIYEGILVDIHMPEMDGFTLMREIKSHITGKDSSIFVLTSDASLDSKMQGLQAGISDYLYKLMNIEEMSLRITNGIERVKVISPIRSVGNLKINTNTFQVLIKDETSHLTLTEYKIILCLTGSDSLSYEVDKLKSFVYHSQYTSDNTFRVHLANLRKKLSTWNYEIITRGREVKLIPN